ncbi:MAG TPA: hypothetical protein VHW44_15440 [Pseudonocardiaceae bacterium]|nr:hypothetical protein [Pseudonocardiaceae bacterium]
MSVDLKSGIESALPDLAMFSLATIRSMDDATLGNALRHAVSGAATVQVCDQQACHDWAE